MAQAFADDVAAQMDDGIEQRHALRLAGDGDIHWPDHILQLGFQHFGGAAQGGFDTFLVPFDQAVKLLQRQRIGRALLVLVNLHTIAQGVGGQAVDTVHEEHARQASQIR